MNAVRVQKPSFHIDQHKLIPGNTKGRGSSVVERIIGNDEVGSSILPRGTTTTYRKYYGFWPALVKSKLEPSREPSGGFVQAVFQRLESAFRATTESRGK